MQAPAVELIPNNEYRTPQNLLSLEQSLRSTIIVLPHVAIMRKMLIRMNSWTNYLFSDGH